MDDQYQDPQAHTSNPTPNQIETAPYLANLLSQAKAVFETANLTEPLNHPSGKPPDKNNSLGKDNRKRQTQNTRSHPYASKTGRDSTRVDGLEVNRESLLGVHYW